MTSANDPSSPAQPQEAQPTAQATDETIPLAPIPAAASARSRAEILAAEAARLDGVLVALVLLLAFFSASIVAFNNDLWMHLATGRLFAQGRYSFGTDPFSYTSSGTWVDHSWLYDFLLYGLASLGGGPETPAGGALLVATKALVVVLLAWVLMRIRRPGQSAWIPACCTALGLVAMSPRLLLQPACLSFLFLGLTLYLLTRRPAESVRERPGPTGRRTGWSPRWLLPPLFALWVNLDYWFLLGPLTLALYWLGELLQGVMAPVRTGEDAPEPGEIGRLGLVLLAGVAACLLNPFHYHAFALPSEVYSPTLEILHQHDTQIIRFYSPFDGDYFTSPLLGLNPAGLAYYVLLLLGLASFFLNRGGGWRWWRVTVWASFALLSAYTSRAIPFFAVVGAPIAALNFQDFAAGRSGAASRAGAAWGRWSLGGRVITVLALLTLLAFTWSGWLHPRPDDPRWSRHVGWAVAVDPSLKRAAQQLGAWRAAGQLKEEEHGFLHHPDVATYCAWFCPEEKGFFDYRFPLFLQAAGPYADVRNALRGASTGRGSAYAAPSSWQKVFREHHINHVVLMETDAAEVRRRLFDDPQQWPLLYLDGRTTIFAWQDPARRAPSELARSEHFRPGALAFGADLPPAERAPEQGPNRPPQRPSLWNRFWKGPAPRPLDADAAILYLEYFQDRGQRWQGSAISATQFAACTGAIGLAGAGGGHVALAARLPSLVRAAAGFADPALGITLQSQGQGPPAALLLAVRAARRAIAATPDQPNAYFGLANSYRLLTQNEDQWAARRPGGGLSRREVLRHVQLVTAYRQTLVVRPDAEDACAVLSALQRQVGFLDLALEYEREAVRLTAAAGPRGFAAESIEQFEERKKALEDRLKGVESDVRRRDSQYEVSAANKPVGEKVQLALQLGLAHKALNVLLEADPTQIGPGEADAQLNLLLMMGRVEDVRERLDEHLQAILGTNYEWYNTLLAAATGDYALAGKYLDEITTRMEKDVGQSALLLVRGQTIQGFTAVPSWFAYGGITSRLYELGDFRVLRGMIALEAGDTAAAARAFRQALDTVSSPDDKKAGSPAAAAEPESTFESRPIAVRYLRQLEDAAR